MKVTVLVAAYNTERYVAQCLDSLLNQTYTDLEIMCVDDASTDGTWDVISRYAAMDSRIRAFRLEQNCGQAVARNYAIERCTGDLVCFLDSDDWFTPDAIAKAVKVFNDEASADCVLFRLVKVWQADTCREDREEEYVMDATFPLAGQRAFELSLDWSIHGVYMVRADLQREILYDDTCRSYSDDNTTRLHFYRSCEVHLCDGTYYYRQNPQSVSHVCDLSQLNFLKANEHMQQMLVDMGVSQELLDTHTRVRWYNLIGCYMFYYDNRSRFTSDDKEKAIHEMCRVWHDIERHRLPKSVVRKFGYAPCHSWAMFRLQEELYFSLRRLKTILLR